MSDEDDHQRLNWTIFKLSAWWRMEIASDPNDAPLFLILIGGDGDEQEPSDSATLLEVISKAENILDGVTHECKAIWHFDTYYQARSEAELRYVLSQVKD